MTHEEAFDLLPAYALGALDEDVEELRKHLRTCERCRAELALYLETTTAMAEAVEQTVPPVSLRRAVLAAVPERPARRPWFPQGFFAPAWAQLSAAAVLLVLVIGLGAWSWVQQQQLQAARSELALSARGLELLTSTETIVERLSPVADPSSRSHGHWYHKPGVATQVVVVEFMPPPTNGEAYFGWLHAADGRWRPLGRFTLDSTGYGRIILLGSDGSDVREVVVTRQKEETSTPQGTVMLRWPT